jgi:hypothetical protein
MNSTLVLDLARQIAIEMAGAKEPTPPIWSSETVREGAVMTKTILVLMVVCGMASRREGVSEPVLRPLQSSVASGKAGACARGLAGPPEENSGPESYITRRRQRRVEVAADVFVPIPHQPTRHGLSVLAGPKPSAAEHPAVQIPDFDKVIFKRLILTFENLTGIVI